MQARTLRSMLVAGALVVAASAITGIIAIL